MVLKKKNVFIILPNQLFENIKLLKNNKYEQIYLWEHPKFFTKYKYHKLKLVYHRATMCNYYQYLRSKNLKVTYISYNQKLTIPKNYFFTTYDPIDFEILKSFKKTYKNLIIINSPLFLLTQNDIKEYREQQNDKFIHHHFYKWIRIKKGILVDENNKPIGGKWSFDSENRNSFDKKYKEYPINFSDSKKIKEAQEYVQKHFSENPGSFECSESKAIYPIDFKSAKKALQNFIRLNLKDYGKYQDAVRSDVVFGTHSVLSPMINIGLLEPGYIIKKILKAYKTSNISISSIEGYLRQLLSWREYVRMLYILKNDIFQKKNFFHHKKKISKEWYNGSTQIQPIDDIIHKVLKYSYAHHIERLMFLGNFMLLSEFHPKEVYKWFISLVSIDAYEWVMVPNIYGMSQFSVGSLMMTRPYFSSSNYIIKMSDYTKKSGRLILEKYYWSDIWNALYYNFIYKNKKYLSKNYSTTNAVYTWNKKSPKEKKEILHIAKKWNSLY